MIVCHSIKPKANNKRFGDKLNFISFAINWNIDKDNCLFYGKYIEIFWKKNIKYFYIKGIDSDNIVYSWT